MSALADEDFEDALARALHGEVLTDLPLTPAMLDALLRIASATDPAVRRRAVRTARALQDSDAGSDPDLGPDLDGDPDLDADPGAGWEQEPGADGAGRR